MDKKLCPACYAVLEFAQNEMRKCDRCGWSGDHASLITEYTVLHIEMRRIYSDGDFNCRGKILPMDIIDLAKDIDRNGLQFPIAVQPVCDVKSTIPEGFNFRIIAGHRRFEALRILKNEEIPAMKFKLDCLISERISNARLLIFYKKLKQLSD